jgi:hypothetical protein
VEQDRTPSLLVHHAELAKYFRWEIAPIGLHEERHAERIQRDAVLDGIYVLRTSVDALRLDKEQTVLAYSVWLP